MHARGTDHAERGLGLTERRCGEEETKQGQGETNAVRHDGFLERQQRLSVAARVVTKRRKRLRHRRPFA